MGKKPVLICWLSIKETIRLNGKCIRGSLLELAGSVSLSPSRQHSGVHGSWKVWKRFRRMGGWAGLPQAASPTSSVSLGNALSLSILSLQCHACPLGLLHTLEKRPLTSPLAQGARKPEQTQNLPWNASCVWRCDLFKAVAHPDQINSQGPHPEASTVSGTW